MCIVNASCSARGQLPRYMSPDSAGADLMANLDDDILIGAGERALVPTGVCLAIPRGYEGQVRPRSGLALKYGVTVLNAPGTIDSDYRGEVAVILVNLGQEPFRVRHGDRIAQLIIAPVQRACFEPVDVLDETYRGSGGFGSTGSGREGAESHG